MSDIIDNANDAAELFLDVAKKNRQPPQEIHGVGFCLNCGDAVEGDARWCGIGCRDDWQRANHRR